ncbi:hypothetical protein KI809_09385 [Geobacter pelophilus]|uniref:Cell division protein FtsZ C-terminal domain-containing protein n=1 Tax=Geoanaerobacter pelophilus TaxID=60036 RepID=A0AAW4LBE1_9BACT|nr:hypothetical protein [Geoanaerobacter pelophilus]MBT0664511.1 hypothetical protein [Geoanaerobacter pelophilus]
MTETDDKTRIMRIIGMGVSTGPDKGVAAAKKALSCLRRQGVMTANIKDMLCRITGSADMSTEDIDSALRYLRSSIFIDIPITSGVVVNEGLGEDVMLITIKASELLAYDSRDSTAMLLCSSENWVMMWDETLRRIPAFQRKRSFMEDNG